MVGMSQVGMIMMGHGGDSDGSESSLEADCLLPMRILVREPEQRNKSNTYPFAYDDSGLARMQYPQTLANVIHTHLSEWSGE